MVKQCEYCGIVGAPHDMIEDVPLHDDGALDKERLWMCGDDAACEYRIQVWARQEWGYYLNSAGYTYSVGGISVWNTVI